MSSTLIFVYGTLKQGFANFHINSGRRVGGEFDTVERFPLYVLGDLYIPWLVNRPGHGEHVRGQLYEVDAEGLARMDVLERVAEPGWYTRSPIRVRPAGDAAQPPVAAEVYFGDAAKADSTMPRSGPWASFSAELNALYAAAPAALSKA